MKNYSKIITKMMEKYSHLTKMGAEIRGVFGPDIELINDKAHIKENPDYENLEDTINIWVPFVFDHRQIPKIYEGIPVQTIIFSDSIPKHYFKAGKDKSFLKRDIDKPEDFIDFVDEFEDDIKMTFNNPDITKNDILDALAYGDFEEYKKHFNRNDFDYLRIMKVNATSFISAWEKFIGHKYNNRVSGNEDLDHDWSSDTNWTNTIIGHNGCLNTGSPLGEALGFHYGNGFNYFREFYHIDLILTRHEKIKYNSLNNKLTTAEMYWPGSLEIIIEHENIIDGCWKEMIKLTYFRAKLKVLISYLPDNIDDENRKAIINTVTNNFRNIIRDANLMQHENEDTEYLMIIGELETNSRRSEIKWHYEKYLIKEIVNNL